MKFRKVLALTVSAAMMIGMLSSCGGSADGGSQNDEGNDVSEPAQVGTSDGTYNVDNIETLTLKVNTSASASTLELPGYGQGIKYFCDEVEKRSNGKVTVEVYPDAQLGGSADEMIGGCQTGAFEFITLNQGSWGGYTDAFMPFNFPFLFPNEEVAFAFMDGEQGDYITQKIIDDTGIRVLCYYDMGFRHLTTKNTPVHTADDMVGLKLRTQNDPYQIAAMEALGAAVTTVAYSELFSALQQGLVDAQENPLSNIVVNKYYEVQNYLTLTGHTYTLTTMAINEDVFQSFSPDLQALMLEVAEDATELCREGLLSQEQVYLEELEQHMEIYEPTEEEKATFKEKASTTWPTIEEEIGSERYNAIIDEVNRISEELGV